MVLVQFSCVRLDPLLLGVSTDLSFELGDETVEREKTWSDEVQWLDEERICRAKEGSQGGKGTQGDLLLLQVFQDKLMKLEYPEQHPYRQCCWEWLFPPWPLFSLWESLDIGSECVADYKSMGTTPCSLGRTLDQGGLIYVTHITASLGHLLLVILL